MKPTFEQLAKRYDMAKEKIDVLYEQFRSFLPSGTEDAYPHDPASMTKEQVRELFLKHYPNVDEEQFESQFALIDIDNSGNIEFDEFMDFRFD